MKKFLSIIMTTMLCASLLVGCTPKDDEISKIGLIVSTLNNPIFDISSSLELHPTNKLAHNIVVIIIERNFFIIFPPTCFFYLKVQLLI